MQKSPQTRAKSAVRGADRRSKGGSGVASRDIRRTPERRRGARECDPILRRLMDVSRDGHGAEDCSSRVARILRDGLSASAAAVVLWNGQGLTVHATSKAAEDVAVLGMAGIDLQSSVQGDDTTFDWPSLAAEGRRGAGTSYRRAVRDAGWSFAIALTFPLAAGFGQVAVYFSARPGADPLDSIDKARLETALSMAFSFAADGEGRVKEAHQFKSLASTIPGVVYQRVVRPDGDIRYMYLSEGARELFGVAPEDVLADPEVLFRTYSDSYRETFRQRLVEASRTLTKWDVEASVVLPDGRTRFTHAVAKPEPLADGSVLWTGVILDASRTKEAEDNLRAANRQVELANKSKSAFLAKMSHEMRTPLNGIIGTGELLLKSELSGRQRRLCTMLCDSSRNLLGIINDVLDLSRIEAGQFKLDMQNFNLRHCMEDAVELCATAGYRKGLEVNLIAAPGLPIGVMGDPMRLRQILINLVGNAVKFTEAGEVAIRVESIPDRARGENHFEIRFEIADTGIGIDKSRISRLFEPFAQEDSSISRKFGGTGLGLSITRHLVELMGGSVSLESKKGEGTTVTAILPFESTVITSEPSILSQVSLAGVRALVVDDRATTRELIMSCLDGTGIAAETAASEDEALRRLREVEAAGRPFDVCIVDRTRPKTSGMHLCRTIRGDAAHGQTAIVMIMSTNWVATPNETEGLGNVRYVSKPMRRADLVRAIVETQSDELSAVLPALGEEDRPNVQTASPRLGLRVLLVEDNRVNIEVALEYLSELGCRALVATNGIEANAAFERATFDVILMDSQMPEMDGLTATRLIREKETARTLLRTPIISVTANAYESDRQHAFAAGADDFLSKPYSGAELRDALVRTLKRASTPPASTAGPGRDECPAAGLASVVDSGAEELVLSESFDVAFVRELSASKPDFLLRIVDAYLACCPDATAGLRAVRETDDGEQLQRLVHGLKSSSAHIGARHLAGLCRKLEAKLKLGADPSACGSEVDAIGCELASVGDQLATLRARLRASALGTGHDVRRVAARQ